MLIKESKIILHLNNKEVIPIEIGIEVNHIKNFEDIAQFLKMLDNAKYCKGAILSLKYNANKSSFFSNLIDCNVQWRHAKCLNLLKNDDK